jgi:hypothetical protein
VRSWAEVFQRPALDWHQSGVVLVGEGQPYNAREVASVVNLPVVASFPDDPAAAAVFSRGAPRPRRFETGPFTRALTAGIASIHSVITQRRNELLDGARR